MAPLIRSRRQVLPAHSLIGCRTQKPMRFRWKVVRASPSMEKTMVPFSSPWIVPLQPNWMSPRTQSALNEILDASEDLPLAPADVAEPAVLVEHGDRAGLELARFAQGLFGSRVQDPEGKR